MKKKIVIKVCIDGNSPYTMKKFVVDFLKLNNLKKCWGHKCQSTSSKYRSKLLSVAAKISGVENIAIEGEGKNELMVMGEDIDATELVSILRKKVGFADIVSVGPVDKKEEEKPKVPLVYGNYLTPPLQYWEVGDPYYHSIW